MVFSSPIFIFIFLPIVLITVFLAGKKLRNFALFVASLIFYAWGEPVFVLIMLFSILMNYVFGLLLASSRFNHKAVLVAAITANLALLGFYKYANFVIENLNRFFRHFHFPLIHFNSIALPIGISFFTFHALSYVIDVYRKETKAQRNIFDLALYIALFSQLIAGPIIRYRDIAWQIKERTVNLSSFSAGIKRFIVGLAKKILIANAMAEVADRVFAMAAPELTFALAWCGVAAYAMQIYFDFSGYSDMAIGLGRMFGFRFMENFNYPYVSQSIREFWRRWHISLSTWFRDYLYIPLGGNRINRARTYINLLIVFLLVGFWHGASWNFVVWGLFYGFFLIIERTWLGQLLGRLSSPIKHIYVLLIVLVGWVLFRSNSINFALQYIRAMFGYGSGSSAPHALNDIINNYQLGVFVVALIASTPVTAFIKNTFATIKNSDNRFSFFLVKINQALLVCALLAIFLYSLMALASKTHNPFIYYRF